MDDSKKKSERHKRCAELFEKFGNQYIKFEKIPEANRRHPRPDICAMIYLHERFGGADVDAVSATGRDEIWLDWDPGEVDITEEDALYLTRCGVRYEDGMFGMFV